MKLKEGMYIRNSNGKIEKIKRLVKQNSLIFQYTINCTPRFKSDIKNASFNLIDLIEYMDLLEIDNPVKLYGENREVSLFNPVRVDGFTEFEDGTHCIILNLDYLVDVKDLKIKSVLTKEQFNNDKYEVR